MEMITTPSSLNKADLSLCAVVGLVTATSIFLNAKARVRSTPGKRVKQVAAPPTRWLDDKEFLVLAAIVDAFIPSYSLSEVSNEKLEALFSAYDLKDMIPNSPLTSDEMLKHRSFLSAGALDYGTHHHLVKAFDRHLSQPEKEKIKGLLGLLSSSAGGFILTGYPVPFHELPLSLREKVLLVWRDHPMEQIRSIFQLFKRGISVKYTSCLNDKSNPPGGDNPIWSEFGYDPEAARANVSITTEEMENDKILRAQVGCMLYPWVSSADRLRLCCDLTTGDCYSCTD